MALGILIKHLRIAKDLKQATVAHRLGISQQAYSKLENCKEVGILRLSKILKAMDSNEEELNDVRKLFTPPPPRR
ncbi:MAG: helix-turn-helix domain-containing protein [Chitinophagaceae bacterium]